MVTFDHQHIADGVKRAASWIKAAQTDDPRVALIASAETLIASCRATGCQRKQVMALLDALSQTGEEDSRRALELAIADTYRAGH